MEPRMKLVEHIREQIENDPEAYANPGKLMVVADRIANQNKDCPCPGSEGGSGCAQDSTPEEVRLLLKEVGESLEGYLDVWGYDTPSDLVALTLRIWDVLGRYPE